MYTSLVKYKDLALKVIYYTKKRQLGTKIFFATSKFQEVLFFFERNLKDSQTFLKSSYFLNGKQIFPNDILLYFCTVDPNLRLVEQDLYLEIEELENIDDSSEPIYERLLKPLINPFKLVILNMKEGILQMVDFPKGKLKDFGFESLVNNNYACCNSPDALYISYGKNFWIIKNKNFIIEKKEMPVSKEKHSMYYVLSNNTIFIAGGSEDSLYYDINSKEFIMWGKMNGTQEKPALIQYGDFLYSFNSYNSSGVYFERTKLSSPAKKWEKLVPQSGDQESGFFYNTLYGVSKCSGGNILFAGGVNNQLRTFMYNLKLNVLYITPSKDESIVLTERTFYKIDHNFNIAIPRNLEKDHIVAIINKNSKSLNLLPFEQIGIKTRNNLLQYQNPRNRLPGNLVIQCRYMALKDYENLMKQKEAQKKSKAGDKKEQIKLGDKLNNDNFKYQYRNKTLLALERISEGKSEEENDEDEFNKNKSSSAKKEKVKLDLGLKPENLGKYNFATQKHEKDDDEKKEKNNSNDTKGQVNNKDNKGNKLREIKHKKINLNLDKKDEGTINNNEQLEQKSNSKKNININKEEEDELNNKNNINNEKEKSVKNNINNSYKGNLGQKSNTVKNMTQINLNTNNNNNNQEQKKINTIQKTTNNNNSNTNTIKGIQQNQIQKSNTSYNSQTLPQKSQPQQNESNPFIDNTKYQNISEKESYHLKGEADSNKSKAMNNSSQIKQNASLSQNENNSYKSFGYKQNITEENNNKKRIGKNNSFREHINISHIEKDKNNQKNKNVNISLRNKNNISLTEGNKSTGKSYISQSVNNLNNTRIKSGVISKQNLNSNKGENNNKEGNKDDKRYIVNKNVQRFRNDGDVHKKNINNNLNEKK